ncbi:uncharacterized protein LDX57_008538 [Aspergillus melleus]|uniref:uncharacterized protein n=1 Tax=Aspergillus melleus TaxID=138277 RepID=UPI001E8CA68E|nr:uncharacterized protein LDX57_008538 [Aspergillus melleus]KAH8430874.1 hypothetical protein LDX57_008538 [Aspergillus melleus]
MSSTPGGDYTALLPGSPVSREYVRSRWTVAYTAGRYEFLFHRQRNTRIPADLADQAFAEAGLETAARLLADGAVLPHSVRLGEGGLAGVIPGLHAMREGTVRGCKLVFNVGEEQSD